MNQYPKPLRRCREERGLATIEALIAVAIFLVLASGAAAALFGSLDLLERSREGLAAEALAGEAWAALVSIRQNAWEESQYAASAVREEDGRWHLSGEGASEQIGDYKREISFYPVYRQADSPALAEAGEDGAVLDPWSRRVNIRVSWTRPNGQTVDHSLNGILCAWDHED